MAVRSYSPSEIVYQLYESKVGRSVAQIVSTIHLIDLTTSQSPVRLLSRRARREAQAAELAAESASRPKGGPKRDERRSTNRPSRKPK